MLGFKGFKLNAPNPPSYGMSDVNPTLLESWIRPCRTSHRHNQVALHIDLGASLIDI